MNKLLITALLLTGSAFSQGALESTSQSILAKLNSGVTCTNGGSSITPTVAPGMGGIPMTGIPYPYAATQIESLGTNVGPAINTGTMGTCDQALLSKYQTGTRSADQPSLAWSCGHLNRIVVTQAAYKSSTNGNCYFADLNGLWKLNNCPIGLPVLPTDSGGNLTVTLNPMDPSINWQALGGACIYTPADTGSQYYGSISPFNCGTSNNGRNAPPMQAAFCQWYPGDSTCNISSTGSAAAAYVPQVCKTAADCGGKLCWGATATQPGTCSAN